jgi:hypothetical protein
MTLQGTVKGNTSFFYWDGRDSRNTLLPAGIYWCFFPNTNGNEPVKIIFAQ